MKRRFEIIALTMCLSVIYAAAQERVTETITEKEFDFKIISLQHTGTDSNRVKLVYASDGYTAEDISTFPGHVESSVTYLTSPGLSVRPLPRYKNFINIYRIDLISSESGISVAPRHGEPKTEVVNNSLGGTRDEDRLGWVDHRLARQLFSEAAEKVGIEKFDWSFVVLNNPGYHNSGGRYVVFSYNFGREIALHEAGHGFFGLADEYYGRGKYERDEPRHVNVTADSTGAKWSHWIGYVDNDTILGKMDVYEGAIYASEGAYRPSKNSKMGWTSDRRPASFNAICREKIILDIYDIVNPVDDAMDTSKTHINPEKIWVKVIDPEVLHVDWYVNDSLILENGGPSLSSGDIITEPGEYTVKAHVYDEAVKHAFSGNDDPHPLDLVRRDLDKLQRWFEWKIVIKN
ncbi:MAG: hypothetical protein JW965_10965 [Bacteroidales bacterium]|nr:hypothetical protein [Bacteroidales bacterium]